MDKPQDILDARLAKGEITLDEYQKLSATITKTAEPAYKAPILAPNHRSSPYDDPAPHPLGPVATALRWIILVQCLITVAVQIVVVSLAWQDDKASANSAIDLMSGDANNAISQFQGLVGLILAIAFFYWLYRGTQNLQRIGVPLTIWPFGAVAWWFVPIAFFWKPYAALSQLWRGSLFGQDWISEKTPSALITWWVLFWIGLALSIGHLLLLNDVHRGYGNVRLAQNNAILAGIIEFINIATMFLLYRIVGRVTEAHDPRLPAQTPKAEPISGAYSWPAKIAIGAAILLVILVKNGAFNTGSSNPGGGGGQNWRISTGADAISGARAIYAHGHPTELSGTNIPPTLILECTGGKPLIAFDYKQPMKDGAPDGTLDFVHVILKVDNDDPVQLTFVPSQDWTVLSQSKGGAVADGTAAILNGIFGDFLPEAKNVRLAWDAQVVLRAIGQSDRLVTRATARNNMAVTATYDLAGFKEAFRAMPSSCQ